jgi:hypothetical protein
VLSQAYRRPSAGAVARARNFHVDPGSRRRGEAAAAWAVPARGPGAAPRGRYEPGRKPVSRPDALSNVIEQNLLPIAGVVLLVGSLGWGLLIYSELHASGLFGPVPHTLYATAGDADAARSSLMGVSSYTRTDPAPAAAGRNFAASADQTASQQRPSYQTASVSGESAATIVAQDWSFFQPVQKSDRVAAETANAKPVAQLAVQPPIHVAAIDRPAPQVAARNPALAAAPRIPANVEAKTSLIDFETAPFPYHGVVPGSDRPFLNAGQQGHLGHVNFRGHVLWESETYSDDHVLLHIPAGFDPKRPAVMVVFFHGHGADLARDVRDRQLVPAQISQSGMNAVLVAPQFAFDAADSSAGKFWEPNGFKRFLDEATQKLATLYGNPGTAAAFAKMPIVIVAYSGGFGPTLSVLDQGGANSRIRGLVLLDALYAGMDKFADWIAANKSTFFVSAYTPHTAHNNAELEHLLDDRSVAYGTALRRNHLQGMVTFLPTGDIPHRDFVTHAWADNPIKDIVARIDDVDPTAAITASR